jgi:hypothetical protein
MATKKAPVKAQTDQAGIDPQPALASPANGDLHGGQTRLLTIRALSDGHRRAGRAWSSARETVSANEFTPAQIEALEADPHLVVEG